MVRTICRSNLLSFYGKKPLWFGREEYQAISSIVRDPNIKPKPFTPVLAQWGHKVMNNCRNKPMQTQLTFIFWFHVFITMSQLKDWKQTWAKHCFFYLSSSFYRQDWVQISNCCGKQSHFASKASPIWVRCFISLCEKNKQLLRVPKTVLCNVDMSISGCAASWCFKIPLLWKLSRVHVRSSCIRWLSSFIKVGLPFNLVCWII